MVALKIAAALSASFVGGAIVGVNCKNDLLSWVNARYIRAASPNEVSRIQNMVVYGLPSYSNISVKKNYILAYDTRLRNASWVVEHLNRDILNHKESNREDCNFISDPAIHDFFRARNEDYFRSGYDRGHLAAASNHRASQEWMEETFYLSNVIPQSPFMNRKAWNKLERHVRSLAYHFDNVYVCTGPLYMPKEDENGRKCITYQVLGSNHVAVPTHLFKVCVCESNSQLTLFSFVMENAWVDPDLPVTTFLCPIESIERSSGLIFFDRIPREKFKMINGHQ